MSSSSPAVLLTPAYPPDRGGLALATARLARGLATRVPLEVVVAARSRDESVEVARHDGVSVVRVTASSWPAVQQAVVDVLRDRAPLRLVHGVYPSRVGVAAVLAARLLGVPVVLAARGNDLLRDVFRADRQAGLLWSLTEADAVVGVSAELTAWARAIGSRYERFIPNGVDTTLFRAVEPDPEWRDQLGLAGHSPLVGFAGEARRKKGLETLLRAVVVLRSRYPNLGLVLLGGVRDDDEGLFRQLLEAVPALGDHVVPTGWLSADELVRSYALLDVYWHPAVSEGLPNAVLEALACERPVVASGVGGTLDVITGSPFEPYLVPPRPSDRAAQALAMATLRLLELDPATRRSLGTAGRSWVEERFSVRVEVDAYLDLYDTLTPSSA